MPIRAFARFDYFCETSDEAETKSVFNDLFGSMYYVKEGKTINPAT